MSGFWVDELWPDREPAPVLVEFEPRRIGFLHASLAAIGRGSDVVHASPLMRQRTPHGDFVYPRLTSLCGVKGWGEATGPVTCRRCLRTLETK